MFNGFTCAFFKVRFCSALGETQFGITETKFTKANSSKHYEEIRNQFCILISVKNIKQFLHHRELQNTIDLHQQTPTWQREGWQLIITTKGGIADKFAPIWVWRSKGCRPTTCRETPTTQETLLLHHGDSGSSLGVWRERRGGIGES